MLEWEGLHTSAQVLCRVQDTTIKSSAMLNGSFTASLTEEATTPREEVHGKPLRKAEDDGAVKCQQPK